MTEGNKSPNRPKRNNNRRRNNQGRKNNAVKSASADPSKQAGDKPNDAVRKNKNNAGRNRRPKSLSPSRVLQKYDNMLEQYLIARKKYYDSYGRSNAGQEKKAKSNYERALIELRKYENNLSDWQRDVLQKKIDGLPADRDYTSTHNIEPKGDIVPFTGDFEDPHLLPAQKSADFSSDKEESIGTYDDYKAYKGIVD